MNTLSNFRRRKDEFFKHDQHSPLTPDQQTAFTGLNYYPENPDLDLELDIERFEEEDAIQMQTSTGGTAEFIRWGRIKFEVDGQPAELTLFQSQAGGGFFMPFMDATSGGETYSSGRYLDPEPTPDGKVVVDFNLAYNPYCAYNEYWTCPIPPKENRLKVPIRAGEKTFEDTGN